MTDLETVATFETLGGAEAARAALEAEGIRALVSSGGLLRMNLFGGDPKRPVQLQVKSEDAGRARQVLGAHSE